MNTQRELAIFRVIEKRFFRGATKESLINWVKNLKNLHSKESIIKVIKEL